LRYLMAFRVFQPRIHSDAEIMQKTAFAIIINQFTSIPSVFSIKI